MTEPIHTEWRKTADDAIGLVAEKIALCTMLGPDNKLALRLYVDDPQLGEFSIAVAYEQVLGLGLSIAQLASASEEQMNQLLANHLDRQ